MPQSKRTTKPKEEEQPEVASSVSEPSDPITGAYTVGKWHGKANYQCRHCPFSTLDIAEMRKHVIGKHVKPVGLFDRHGNPLARMEAN